MSDGIQSQYYAYQVYCADETVDRTVDTDPGLLWARLAAALVMARRAGGVKGIEVGRVDADGTASALDAVRAGQWIRGSYGFASGIGERWCRDDYLSLRHRLLDLLRERSFFRGDFVLASGQRSNYYVDVRKTVASGPGARLVGELLYWETAALSPDAIGGLEVGAVPVAMAAVVCYQRRGKEVEGFWVRKAPKGHGAGGEIEGLLPPGRRVVVVEDVATTGESALRAVRAVRAAGCEVAGVRAVVDRRQGAGELLAGEGVDNYRALFSPKDFGVA